MSLLDLTATQLAKAIKKGDVTAVDAMQAVIEQIENKEKELNCYVTFDKEAALKKAGEVQAGIEDGSINGPLAGVPVAIKDNMCTEGVLTTCSSRILGNFIPAFSAEAVIRLEEAGAVIIGKTMVLRVIHGIRSMYREVHQVVRPQPLQRENVSLRWDRIQADR